MSPSKIYQLLRRVTMSGLHQAVTPHDRKSLLFINRMSILNVLLMIIFSATAPFFDLSDVLFFTIPFMFVFALPPYFNATGRLDFSRYYFAIIPLVFLIGVCIHNSAELGDKYLILTSAIMPLILFKDRKTIYLLFVLNIASFFLVTIYQSYFDPLVKIPGAFQWIYSSFSVLTVFIIIFFILQYFRNDSEDYEEELESKNREISQKNHEIIDSITYARRLQEAILPPEEEIYNSAPDSFILYKPKDIVAGDFYFAEHKEDYFFVAAADCTGHGVPGAMVSLVCSNALNKAVTELGLIKPGEILDKVTEMVVDTFKKGHADIKDGMDISLCVINTRTREIAWAGANNPLWYVQGEELKEITATKQPVGKSEKYTSFTTHVLNLAKGSLLYLFTDGFADQFGGPKGKKFKYKQLAELIFTNRMLSMAEQRHILDQTFNTWKGNIEQVDDVCIIGIKL